jgi:ATP-dependent Clp protease, protease subunit
MKGLDKFQNSLFVTGEIGYDFRAEDFIKMLYDGAEIHIYSGGGSLFDALAVYDFIKQSKINVDVFISGLAGSAATVIACASNNVQIGANSFYFVHHAFIQGGISEDTQVMLDECNKRIVDIYQEKTKKPRNEIKALLKLGDEGAFLTSQQAYDFGFVNKIFKEQSIAAHKPYLLTNSITKNEIMNIQEITDSVFNKVKEYFDAKDKTVSAEELKNAVNNAVKPLAEENEKLKAEAKESEESEKTQEEENEKLKQTLAQLQEENEKLKEEMKSEATPVQVKGSLEGKPESVANMSNDTLSAIKNLIKQRKGL